MDEQINIISLNLTKDYSTSSGNEKKDRYNNNTIKIISQGIKSYDLIPAMESSQFSDH